MTNKKRRKQPAVEVDMDATADLDMGDVNMNEVTDSEEEYTETERRLLRKVRARRTSENYDSGDEVYKLRDENESGDEEDEEEADSMESDIEGLQEDDDLPNERAWGKKKRTFYSTDFVDPDYAAPSQRDLAEAEIEEQEARSIQKRLAEQLDDADFGLDFIQPQKDKIEEGAEEAKEEIVKTDLTKLSKRQRQALMRKESPEFSALVDDFKDRMTEARDVLAPYLKLVENRTLPDCRATWFVRTKYHLTLNYCVNISFYLMLKAKRLPVNSHPVIKRLAQYRQLLNQLESGQGDLMNEIRDILRAEMEGKPLYQLSDGTELIAKQREVVKGLQKKLKKKKTVEVEEKEEEQEEKVPLSKATVSEDESAEEETEEEEEEEEKEEEEEEKEEEEKDENLEDAETPEGHRSADSEGKRAITYEMAKNKGLTPHRKKEQRNPRVKHRNKYRKAKIRRKGAVREVRKEVTRYAGEISGIKASVKKSIKLK